MKYKNIIKKLKSLSNPKAIIGMARYGITPENTYGVSIPNLRKIAKEIGISHKLAQQLWASDIRETKILASMIEDLEMVTEEQTENWVNKFNYWEICDQCCMNLFEKTRFAYKKQLNGVLQILAFFLGVWYIYNNGKIREEQNPGRTV
ncbi:MAG: DNA alkylation repair protein [Candidatus Atribacteria bacterium]